MIALLSLLAVANVALHVEELRGVSTASTAQVLESLASVIEERTGQRVTLDASDWVDCGGESRRACIDQLRAKNGGGDVIMLVLVGGITKLRVLGQRISSDGHRREASIDLPKRSEERRASLGAFVDVLFPVPRMISAAAAPQTAHEPAKPPSTIDLPSWIAIGVAATTATLAIVYQAKSARAHDALSTGLHTPAEVRELIDERRGAQLTSSALLIAVGVSAVAAVVFEVVAE